jgi:hypothetical protein
MKLAGDQSGGCPFHRAPEGHAHRAADALHDDRSETRVSARRVGNNTRRAIEDQSRGQGFTGYLSLEAVRCRLACVDRIARAYRLEYL